MGNTFANVGSKGAWVVNESLRQLLNKLVLGEYFDKSLSREYKQAFPVGSTIHAKLPWRPIVRNGTGYSEQAIERLTTPIVCDQVKGVDFQWDSVEKALDMERGKDIVRKEYIEPAISAIAQEIDSYLAQFAYYHTPNVSGALGTTPTALSTYGAADQLMYEQGCPVENRALIVSAGMNQTIASNATLLANNNPQGEISFAFKNGYIRQAMGFDWYRSNSLYSHTAGTWANTCTIQTTPSNGATSLVVGGTVTETFKRGDIFKIISTGTTNVNAVNPGTRRSTGSAKTFVVTQDLTLTGGTSDVLYFEPAMYGPGSPYQNVDVLPTGGTSTITNWPGTTAPGTGPKAGINGLALQRYAFALVSVPMELPEKSVEIARAVRDPESGISISIIRAFDPKTLTWVNRLDTGVFGCGVLYAQHCAVRIASLI